MIPYCIVLGADACPVTSDHGQRDIFLLIFCCLRNQFGNYLTTGCFLNEDYNCINGCPSQRNPDECFRFCKANATAGACSVL